MLFGADFVPLSAFAAHAMSPVSVIDELLTIFETTLRFKGALCKRTKKGRWIMTSSPVSK